MRRSEAYGYAGAILGCASGYALLRQSFIYQAQRTGQPHFRINTNQCHGASEKGYEVCLRNQTLVSILVCP